MSSNKSATRRLSLLAAAAAVFAAPAAFAADTTTTIAVGTTQTTAVTASPTAPDTYRLNILGALSPAVTAVSVQGTGTGPVVITNDGRLQGRFNFTGSSPVTLRNDTGANPVTQGWHFSGVTTFGSGNDLIDNAEDGVIAATAASTLAFGAGTSDTFTNAGRLITERSAGTFSPVAGTLTFTGLEIFNNSGVIVMGAKFDSVDGKADVTDRQTNDRLIAQGVAFTGSGASRIAMDVNLTNIAQVGCPTVPTAADCIDFTGGSTAGSTLLTIRDASNKADGETLNPGIALIVGSSAAGDFTLSPDSDYYVETSSGPALQRRLVAYRLVYDDAIDSHKLVGTLADEAFQSSTFAASAQEAWRSTTGSWFDRQADLRATPGGLGASRGFWARGGVSAGKRDVQAAYTQGGASFDYDVSQKQRTAHAVFGADLVGDGAWVFGVMAGFVRSDTEFDASPTEVVYAGFTGGVYASWVAGPLFVDAAFNANVVDMNADVPNMRLGAGVKLNQTITSMGGRVEAGWRIATGQGVFVEPLASLSYVQTKQDGIVVPGAGGVLDFDEDESLRAGAGVRLGMDSELMGYAASYSLTGRYSNEFDGENATTILGADAVSSNLLTDDFSGGFGEIGASVNLYSGEGGVSGFANLGGKFADDYQSIDGAIGVRLRW